LDGIGMGKLRHEDQFFLAGSFECFEEIHLQQGFEAALHRHPDGLRLQKALERTAGREIRQLGGDRSC